MSLTDEEEQKIIDDMIYAADNSTFATTDDLRRNNMRAAFANNRVALIDKTELAYLHLQASGADAKGSMILVGFMVVSIISAAMGSLLMYMVVG